MGTMAIIAAILGALGVAGGLAKTGTEIYNAVESKKQADAQNALNMQTLEFNKDQALHKYERTVEDLGKAGLSATLASGAQATTVQTPTVARPQMDIGDGLFQASNAMNMVGQMQQLQASIENTNAQTQLAGSERQLKEAQALKTIEETKGTNIDNKTREAKNNLQNSLLDTQNQNAQVDNRIKRQQAYQEEINSKTKYLDNLYKGTGVIGNGVRAMHQGFNDTMAGAYDYGKRFVNWTKNKVRR